VGLNPRYVFDIKSSTDSTSASMFDLRARVTAGANVLPRLRAYGLGAVGYAWISLPSFAGVSPPSPSGVTFTFGGGVAYSINTRARVVGEIAYELGRQSSSTGDYHVRYLEVDVGLAIALGR
jgi:hypothetical protein